MKTKTWITGIAIMIAMGIEVYGCASTKLTERGGVQLWSENCARCHNTPPSSAFTADQWETIGTHMQIRAGLTDDETKQVMEFLQSHK